MTELHAGQGVEYRNPIRNLVRPIPVRTAVRFPVHLTLTIESSWGQFEAVTENVSATGILFVCRFLPEFVGPIEFSMTMPSAVLGTAKDVTVRCIGRIVRRKPGNKQTIAAVVIDEYLLKA